MDEYDVAGACQSVREHLDVLTNWYVRRSRARFWDGESDASHAAFDTLYTALEVLCRVAAPLLPLVDRGHLARAHRRRGRCTWPTGRWRPTCPPTTRWWRRWTGPARSARSASSLRKAGGLRVRLPLLSLTVAADDADALEPFVDIVADEVNVREVRLVSVPRRAAASASRSG